MGYERLRDVRVEESVYISGEPDKRVAWRALLVDFITNADSDRNPYIEAIVIDRRTGKYKSVLLGQWSTNIIDELAESEILTPQEAPRDR